MRLTVLGCHSPYPGPGGATAGYLVESANCKLLLDCGSGVVSQLGNYLPIYQLDGLLLSHYHHDHVADVGVLQYGLMAHHSLGDLKQPLTVYAPAIPYEWTQLLHYKQATIYHPIDETSELTIKDMQISFLRTDHPVPLCLAMKIRSGGKTIVYGADSGPLTRWESFARDADLFICEGTFLSSNLPDDPHGHLSVRQAAELADELACKALLLTHLFHLYGEEEVRAEASGYGKGVCHLARVGLQLEIGAV